MDIIKILGMDFIVQIFDIVEGPMADDQIWNFVEGFIDGRISRRAFWELVKFNYPTCLVYRTHGTIRYGDYLRLRRMV